MRMEMKFDLQKSKLIRKATEMPPLSHNVVRDGDGWVRDSEALRWLSTQEDLQMWMFSILRAAGLVVFDKDSGKYVGEKDWTGKRKWENQMVKSGGRWIRQSKRGGRAAIHSGNSIVEELSKPLYATELWDIIKSKEGMARSTMFRFLKKLRESGVIECRKGRYQVKSSTETTAT